MPKIIENLRNDILNESMNIIDERGIDALSIRSLSSKLDIAPSTIYNYYGSKEDIIAALLRQRWENALIEIDKKCSLASDTVEAFEEIVSELRKSVKPLLRMHISSVHGSKLGHAHSREYQKVIFSELEARVRAIISEKSPDCKILETASGIITKLLISCTHDPELRISDIIDIAKAL